MGNGESLSHVFVTQAAPAKRHGKRTSARPKSLPQKDASKTTPPIKRPATLEGRETVKKETLVVPGVSHLTKSPKGERFCLSASAPTNKEKPKNEAIFFPFPSPLVLRKKREASINGNNNMEDFFEGMPVEMLFYILQFLEIYELARLSLVCKYFKEILEHKESDTILWRAMHDRTFGGGGRKTLYYRVDLRKGNGRPWEVDANALYWRRVCIDEYRQLRWRAKNRDEKLRWAAEKGHWRIVKDVLARDRNRPNITEVNRLMVISAGEGHIKTVEILANMLLAAGVGLDGVGITPKNSYCALLKAALWGNTEVVRLLLNKGADVNMRDRWGETACIKAARAGHKDVVKVLLSHKKCDVKLKNADEDDALLACAKAGNMDVLQVLLASGAEVSSRHQGYLQFLEQIQGLG